MANTSPYTYSFNQQDYEFTIRLYNGVNSVYLTNTAWDDLFLEENLFDIFVKGSIVVNNPYNLLERSTDEANKLIGDKTSLEYKFRNDGRDTLYISIKPKSDGVLSRYNLTDDKWLIELETVIYDVQELPSEDVSSKKKKLFFWEKTYQLMTERDSEFSTALVGVNKNKSGLDQSSDDDRSLPTGQALYHLINNDPFFKQHIADISKEDWNDGDSSNLIFHTSPVGSKFIDDLYYLYNNHCASASEDYQPCILKLERAKKKGKLKQFSLKTIESYFKNAGNNASSPGSYQIEHFFLRESDEQDKAPLIKKTPLANNQENEIKADEYNIIRGYNLVDLTGKDYAKNLANRRVVSYNSTNRQWNIEAEYHSFKEWQNFFNSKIRPNILLANSVTTDRLPVTPYIDNGLNTVTEFSTRPKNSGRYITGRNKILKYFLFSNICISFATRGLTHRQPGRFFGLSKQTLNNKEYDHKLEGQYFTVGVKHYFSNVDRSYYTEVTGVKTHVYRIDTPLPKGDVLILGSPVDYGSPLNPQPIPFDTSNPLA